MNYLRLSCLVLLLAGCPESNGNVTCTSDTQCVLPGQMGICVGGFCALPDSTCDSGYRFDKTAGGYANMCASFGSDLATTNDLSIVDLAFAGPDFSGDDFSTRPNDMGSVISSGTFAPGKSIGEKTGPNQVFAADYNGDNKLDLLILRVLPNQASTVLLRLGAGDGSFAAGNVVWTGADSSAAASAYAVQADVDGDGTPDLIVNERGAVTSLIWSSAGAAFNKVAWTTPGTGFTPGSAHFAAGDLDGDKKADLVTVYGGDVYSFVGDGTGQFTQKTHAASVATQVYHPHIFDVTGDGKPDAVFATPSAIVWLPGAGDGTLGSMGSVAAAAANSTVGDFAFGNFNGDTHLDLLVEQIGPSSITSLALVPGTGSGTFGSLGTPVVVAKTIGALATGDLDGNGVLDAVLISSDATATNGQGLYVLLNSNAGLGSPSKYGTGFVQDTTNSGSLVDVTVGRFNADLIPDLIASGSRGGTSGNGDVWFYAGQ